MDLLDQLRVSRGFGFIVYPTTSGMGGNFYAMTLKELNKPAINRQDALKRIGIRFNM